MKILKLLTLALLISFASSVNAQTADEIINKHIEDLKTPMCGWTSVLSLLYLTAKTNLNYALVDYKNSGDVEPFGDKDHVVGYGAFVITENKTK